MKRFEIHAKDDGRVVLAVRPTGWGEVRGLLLELKACGEVALARYYVSGKEVNWSQALAANEEHGDAELAKKRETHREISWLAGSCENTRRRAWVRK